MRMIALVLAGFFISAAALPAAAACPYKDQVAQSDIKTGNGSEGGPAAEQSRS